MPTLNPTTLRAHIYLYLHGTDASDALIADDVELNRILSDRLSALATEYGIFVNQDESFITLVTGTAMYALPPRHLDTMHVALDDRPLVASSREELYKRDRAYSTTAATVARPIRRFYEDKSGFNQVGLHPVPSAVAGNGERLEVIYHYFPCEVTDDVKAPAFIGDLLEVQTTRELYMKESDLGMPEVAKSLEGLAGIYTDLIGRYWGKAQ